MSTTRSSRVALIALAVLGSGCASIIKGGGSQSVSIRSLPPDADVKVIDTKTGNTLVAGKTPLIVPLQKSHGYFSGGKYRVLVEKAGYASQEALIDSSVNGWYIAGNLVFGGLIGWLIVDPATGAMWSLDPDELSIELQALTTDKPTAEKPVAVMMLDELTERHPELLGKMKPVAAAARD
jgi:hypothetical protein